MVSDKPVFVIVPDYDRNSENNSRILPVGENPVICAQIFYLKKNSRSAVPFIKSIFFISTFSTLMWVRDETSLISSV